MITHSPKQNFLNFQKEPAATLQEQRESFWLTTSFSYTLAEMAHLGATTEQLNGARNFIQIFQNLWDRGEAHQKLPVKRLQSYDEDVTALLGQQRQEKPKEDK